MHVQFVASRLIKSMNQHSILGAITRLMAIILLLSGPFCFAQGTTSVLGGKAFDSQGNVIQNAAVTLTSDDTGVQWTAKTNETGNWRVDALIAGHYHFSVYAPGFKTAQYPSFELTIADQKFLDVTLEVGTSTASVTVEAAEPLIDTTAAVSGTILENKDIEELPTTTNSANEFAMLTPGLFYSYTASSQGENLWSNLGLSTMMVNGIGAGNRFALNFTIDGATDTIASNGQMAFIPPLDTVQEVRVTANAYDASISRMSAGALNMMMKSGGKDFHGDLYEINKNNFMNANTYQNNLIGKAIAPVRHNEYGGTVGGPFWIPKLYDGRKRGSFFFFSYDGIRDISPYSTGTMSLPTQQERNGDFSASYTTQSVGGVVTKYAAQLFDPSTGVLNSNGSITRTAISGENVSGRISPMAKAIMALVPLPNRPSDGANTDSNDFVMNNPQFDKFYSIVIRGDQAWNNNHHSYVEYKYNNFNQFAGNPFGLTNILEGTTLIRINHGITASHAWVISPRLFLNVTGNATLYRTFSLAPNIGLDPTAYGFSSQLASQQIFKGLPALNGVFGSSGTGTNNVGGAGDSYGHNYEYEAKGYLQQIYRNHTLHYGAEYLVAQEATGDRNGGAGSYSFSGIWTVQNPVASSTPAGYGSYVADFLMGMPASGNINNDAEAYYSQPYIGFYAQDDWRVTPKLTLNLGLRWDYQLAMTERHDKYWSRFDPNYNLTAITNYIQPNMASLLGGSGSSNLGLQLLQAQKPSAGSYAAKGGILYAGVNGTNRSITEPEPNYWQPRIGFAYQLRPTTVIRGGLGRFVQGSYVANYANQTGYSSTTTYLATNNNYLTQASTLSNPFPSGLVSQTGNSLGVYTNPGSVSSFYSPNVKRQYTDDYSLHLQQEFKDYLVEIGGVFEHTTGLPVAYQINNPSVAAWKAAYAPQFDSTGRPIATFAGDTKVTNPFLGAPYITSSLETGTTISAYQLLRPNSIVTSLQEYFYNGTSDNTALHAKVQRRLRNGFSVNYAFSWGKQMDKTGYMTNSVISQELHRQISSGDIRFQHTIAASYILPFGKGQLIAGHSGRVLDSIIGGWELSGTEAFYSGIPIALPTNSSFYEGGDPSLGSKKSRTQWFDTSKFYMFPKQNTTTAQIAAYPSWTGVQSMPGYNWTPTSSSDSEQNGVFNDFSTWSTNNSTRFGDVRNPYSTTINLGLRKAIPVYREMRLQLRLDAFNAVNHPQFSNVDLTAGDTYFGYMNGSSTLSQTNNPRTMQLEGKFYF